MRRSRFLLPLLVAVLGLAAAGCSGSSQKAAGPPSPCGQAFEERLDPRSTQHIFPGAVEPFYTTDPPTSGPHQLGPPPTGALTTPITRPKQVHMLEIGFVIVQYQGLAPGQVTALGSLAGPLVTVAPAAGPLPAPVVATAWTWKQTCTSVSGAALDDLRAFIAARRGKGFAGTR